MLRFDDWMLVNDERAEVMAGQHRIEALREYVRQTRGNTRDLWWVCEFYDKGEQKMIGNALLYNMAGMQMAHNSIRRAPSPYRY